MIDYYYCYTKKKSDVGRKCDFKKSKSQIIGRIEPNKELKNKFIYKENIYYNDDNIKKYSEQYVNIESLKLENKFFYHNEGGWTKDIDISEHQNKIKYIKRLEKDINLINSLKILMNETTKIINKNNSINIYEEYFKNDLQNEEDFRIKSILIIKDKMRKYQRFITSIKWSTDNTHKLAISYCVNDYQKILNNSPKNCLLYDLNQINNPYQTLYSKTFIKCLRFNHKNSDLLLAGSYEGTINLWDLRKKNTLCDSSLINVSHKNIVHDVIWLQTKTNNHCLSISNDGLCLIWDIRDFSNYIESFYLKKDPTDFCELESVNDTDNLKIYNGLNNKSNINNLINTSNLNNIDSTTNTNNENSLINTSNLNYSANCLEWNLEAGPSKILIGTDEGYILSLSKRQSKNLELLQKYGVSNERHLSAITSIKRIPINLKYFLSTDKWGFNIWSEDIKFPIISNYYNECVINKGLWIYDSSFFMLIRKDGYLDFWNLLYNFNEPIIKHKICNCSITEIDAHSNNKFISVGNEKGDIHILKLGESFCKNSSEEKNSLDELFERESKREKNLEYIRKQLNCIKKKKDYLNVQDIQIMEDIIKETEKEYESLI
ncbi:dynein-associated protein, putative [Plasmodium gallinaceum]|uniref:Dynein-associated protein, putative n=1 Tax=Plasmodium gallinaceum TaxID=5849 RepID=A0A1J1GWT3_PLAGA|nr:dynein-associated protein, putative [Plasmodium gallinaceum]CRG95765.1 dynein-associated protein, putative [Plasmodium gallinaceum]